MIRRWRNSAFCSVVRTTHRARAHAGLCPYLGHAFCQTCILGHIGYLESTRDVRCPQCRFGPITEEDLYPLFLQLGDDPPAASPPEAGARAVVDSENEWLNRQLGHVKRELVRLGTATDAANVKHAAEEIGAFRGVRDIVVLVRTLHAFPLALN